MLDSIDEIISQALQDRHCKISHRLDLIRYYKRWNNIPTYNRYQKPI